MYQPTTAIRKIARLKKKTRAIQGGQGAGKTIAILILLINHAQHNPDREITILQAELSKLKKTAVRDFIKIMKSYGMFEVKRWHTTDSMYTFPNGSYIEFLGLDRADIGKGFRRDVLYFNEINKGGITLDAYTQFASRAGVVYFDFNPDRKFWVHDEVINQDGTEFLILTFNDNEFLPKGERDAILDYQNRAFYNKHLPVDLLFQDKNIKSKYWANKWRVYGLGLVGHLDGIIFTNYTIIDKLPKVARYLSSGLDFGYSNDPTTLVDRYRYNRKNLYDEALYRTGMVNSAIAKEILDFSERRKVIADSAEPKSIEEISRHGCRILPADKGKDSINYGIDKLQEEPFLVTARSKNLILELQSYTWAVDRDGNTTNTPIDKWNHCIDGMRYDATKELRTGRGEYAIH